MQSNLSEAGHVPDLKIIHFPPILESEMFVAEGMVRLSFTR